MIGEKQSDRTALFDFWSSLIGSYSRRELTKGHDRLLAIAGVAKLSESLLKDDYLAGCWKKQLPWQLLWRRGRGQDSQDQPHVDGIPSWSWASVLGDVEIFNAGCSHTVAQVLETEVDAEYGNRFGVLKSGRIRVRCPSIQVLLESNDQVKCKYFGTLELPDGEVHPKIPQEALDFVQNIRSYWNQKEPKLTLAIIQTSFDVEGRHLRTDPCVTIQGILLMRTSNREGDDHIKTYRRVGAICIEQDTNFDVGPKMSCIPQSWHKSMFIDWDSVDGQRPFDNFDLHNHEYLEIFDIV